MSKDTVNIFKNKIARLKRNVDKEDKDNNYTKEKVVPINEKLLKKENLSINKKILKRINVNTISPNPFQPRKIFEEINELANSIKEKGLIQPISVISISKNEYMLIAGERRLRAFKLLQEENVFFNEIEAVVFDSDMTDTEKEIIAALENIQRKDMTIIDTANLYASINKKGLTYNEMVNILGESKTSIARYMKISKLPDSIKSILNRSDLKSTNKIELLSMINGNLEEQKELAEDIINNETFIRIEKKIRAILSTDTNIQNKNTEFTLSLYEQIKPTSKIISKANYRKLDNDKRIKVDELLNTIIETQKQILDITN